MHDEERTESRAAHGSVHPDGDPWRSRATALRRQGLTYRKIGQEMGISAERARQLVAYGNHYRRVPWGEPA